MNEAVEGGAPSGLRSHRVDPTDAGADHDHVHLRTSEVGSWYAYELRTSVL